MRTLIAWNGNTVIVAAIPDGVEGHNRCVKVTKALEASEAPGISNISRLFIDGKMRLQVLNPDAAEETQP